VGSELGGSVGPGSIVLIGVSVGVSVPVGVFVGVRVGVFVGVRVGVLPGPVVFVGEGTDPAVFVAVGV
jgi:hypothetical protein